MAADSVLARYAAAVVAAARARGLSAPAISALEGATAELETLTGTAADWQTKMTAWQGALNGLVGSSAPPSILESMITRRLPPIPGLEALPIPLNQLPSAEGFQRSASLGPVEVGVTLPAAIARYAFDPSATRVVGLLPPSGASLRLNAGLVTGSGNLDFQEGPPLRLSGSFGLKLGTVDVFAFGILERRADAPFALLLLLGARFFPAIELSFGFSLAGVGGLIGINRRSNQDAMRERLSSGAAVEALFPADPTRNAPSILNTLEAIFPSAPGSQVVGPTLQLTWVKIGSSAFVQADVGLFLELPGPSRIVLVGRLQAELPQTGSAVLHLRCDLLGIVDFQQQLISFDASLVGSQALQVFRISGDAAFRFHWGAQPYAVLTVGGFYPGFNPAPAVLPPLRRASLALLPGLSVGLSIRAEAYFAVTTNSFQLGGTLDVLMGFAGCGLAGFVSLDAIVHFSPFAFHVDGTFGLAVRALGRSFGQMNVHVVLDGPAPVTVRASVRIDVLFIHKSFSHTFTLGSGSGPPALLADLRQVLVAEIARPTNLHAQNGDDPHAIQSPGPVVGAALLSPLGRLVWSQTRAPLEMPIEKIDGVPLGATRTARVHSKKQQGEAREWFSPGAFRSLTASQAVNQSSYEEQISGLGIGFTSISAPSKTLQVKFVDIYRTPDWIGPVNAPQAMSAGIRSILLRAVDGRQAAPTVHDRSPLIGLVREAWVVRNGASVAKARSESAAHALSQPPSNGQDAVVAVAATDLIPLGTI